MPKPDPCKRLACAIQKCLSGKFLFLLELTKAASTLNYESARKHMFIIDCCKCTRARERSPKSIEWFRSCSLNEQYIKGIVLIKWTNFGLN